MPRFSIQFRTDPVPSAEMETVLEAAGIELVADYGSMPPDAPGDEYRPDTHVVSLEADNAEAAGGALTEAVKEKAIGFKLVSVTPEP